MQRQPNLQKLQQSLFLAVAIAVLILAAIFALMGRDISQLASVYVPFLGIGAYIY